MVVVEPQSGTVYLNAATVPRVKPSKGSRTGASLHHFMMVELQQHAAAAAVAAVGGDDGSTAAGVAGGGGTYVVRRVDEVWVEVEPLSRAAAASSSGQADGTGEGAAAQQQGSSSAAAGTAAAGCRLAEERLRVKAVPGERGVVVMVWQGHKQQLTPVILSEQAAARYTRVDADDDEAAEEGEPMLQQVAA
jgi:hypothetical protein